MLHEAEHLDQSFTFNYRQRVVNENIANDEAYIYMIEQGYPSDVITTFYNRVAQPDYQYLTEVLIEPTMTQEFLLYASEEIPNTIYSSLPGISGLAIIGAGAVVMDHWDEIQNAISNQFEKIPEVITNISLALFKKGVENSIALTSSIPLPWNENRTVSTSGGTIDTGSMRGGGDGIPEPVQQTMTIEPNYVAKNENGTVLYTQNYQQLPEGSYSTILVTPTEIVIHWDGNSSHDTSKWLTSTTYNGLVGRNTATHFAVGVDGVLQMVPMTENQISLTRGAPGHETAINIEFAGANFDIQQIPPPCRCFLGNI